LVDAPSPSSVRAAAGGADQISGSSSASGAIASGRVDIWLNGTFCGTCHGPMADRDYGARRNGTPFINAQPRFGIYRDWRAETQTLYFDKIMFWNADPSGYPDWGLSPPPGRLPTRPRPRPASTLKHRLSNPSVLCASSGFISRICSSL
jgi:hypothetical protein